MHFLSIDGADERTFQSATGQAILMRPAMLHDTSALADLLAQISDESWYRRYLSPRPRDRTMISTIAQRMTHASTLWRRTLLATTQTSEGEMVHGVAELVRDPLMPYVAEIAVVVRDDVQNQGIGSALASWVVDIARRMGLTTLRADLLASNRGAQRLLRHLDLPYSTTVSSGEMLVFMQLQAQNDANIEMQHLVEHEAVAI